MLATDKQINYLQQLADKVERMHKAAKIDPVKLKEMRDTISREAIAHRFF